MWHYQDGNTKLGPIGAIDLMFYIRDNKLNPDGQVIGPGVEKWTALREVQALIVKAAEHPEPGEKWRGSAAMCIFVGVVSLVAGAYYLHFAPGLDGAEGLRIVNLQRLAIGMTECIVGAIFVAAGIRPRD